MAQTGFTPIQLYSSSTTGNTPAAADLLNSSGGSELAINIFDGKLFYKDSSGNVQVIGWKVVPVSAGGTGQTSYTDGQLLIGNTTGNTLTKATLTAGTGITITNGSGAITINGTGGTVTSVAALTLGTTGTDLSSTVANGTTTPVITLNVPTASATNRGALSAADWTTFNNKQPAGTYVTNLTGPITSVGNATSIASQTGTGTTFAMSASPTFTGTVGAADLTTTGNTILGNASTDTMNVGNGDLIKDASGNVGIGTASPGAKLDINVGSAGRLRITETTGATLFDNVNTAASAFVTEMHRASSYAWGIGSALPATSMTLDASGNLLVGTTTDAGRVTIYGADSGAVNYALRVRSSSGTDGLIVRNDPYVGVPNNYNITTGSAANMYFGADGFIYRSTSSARYKTDIRNYDKGLDSVLSLRPVYYKSNNPDIDGNIPTTQFAGLIAEELDEVGLTEFVVYNNENQPEAIHYGNMISLLTKAIQEQQAIITSLTARLDALEG